MEQQRSAYHQQIREHLSTAYLLSDEKIETVLPRFLATIRTLMAELEDLALSDRMDALSRAGHAMKGALLNLGLPELAEKAFSIEKLPLANEIGRDCVELVDELQREIRKIL